MTPLVQILIALAAVILIVLFVRQLLLTRQMKHLVDVAEQSRRQLMQEHARNQRLKQEMTNNIAHELKTPVSSIMGYLEILMSNKPIDEEKKRYFLERCYSQTLRLSDLIRDVSLINKIEESADLFPTQSQNLSDIVHETLVSLEQPLAERHITVRNLLPDVMTIEGNHSLLYAIFRNLVENVVEHAGDGVTLGIECYKETDADYYLHLYDTGVGVDSHYLPVIFDRFLRIDPGRSRKNGGTGLGLSIVKHAVLFHGGEIYAKNRQQGGLEFFFTLKKHWTAATSSHAAATIPHAVAAMPHSAAASSHTAAASTRRKHLS